MNIQIVLPTEDIEKKINSILKPILYQGNVAEYDDVRVVVVKRDIFRVKVENDTVIINAPIRAELFIGKKLFHAFIPNLTKNIEEIDVDVRVKYEIKPEVSPQWGLNPVVKGTYSWDKDPSFSIAGIPLPIKAILEIVLDTQVRSIRKTIEKFLRDELNIRQYVQLAWDIMQKPLTISDGYPLHLYFQPSPNPIYATPIRCNDGVIYTTISVPLFPEGVVGFAPHEDPYQELPSFTPVSLLSIQEDIMLAGRVNFRFIEKFLQDKSIEQEGLIQKIHIRTVAINADENGLLHFVSRQTLSIKWGFIAFDIPFTGEVTADMHPDASHLIRFEPVEIELTKAPAWVKFFFNIFKDKIHDLLISQMQSMANAHWNNLQTLLKTKLAALSVGDYVLLNADVFRFNLSEIQVNDDNLKAIVQATASAKITIQNF